MRVLSFPFDFMESKFYPGSSNGSAFTVMAAALGTGILTLPFAVNLTGLYLGIANIIFGFCVAVYSTNIMIICAERSQC
jgi:amino acid permease